MSTEGPVILKAKKFLLNRLLSRKQMVLEVLHPGQANVSNQRFAELIAKKFKADVKNVVTFGFHTHFGGGRTTGFVLIYDNNDYLLKYEPKYRLRRMKILEPKINNRKARKELKTKRKKVRGKEKSKIQAGKKK